MSEHSEEELLVCTLIVSLVLLMQLSSFILIPNPALWSVKGWWGSQTLLLSLLWKYKETNALTAAPPVLGSPSQELIPVDAVLTRASHFCREPVTAERRAVKQDAWAGPLSPLLLAALTDLAVVIHLHPLMHMDISWPPSSPGSVILQSQPKKRNLQQQTTAVTWSPKIWLYSLAYKHKKSVPKRCPCQIEIL